MSSQAVALPSRDAGGARLRAQRRRVLVAGAARCPRGARTARARWCARTAPPAPSAAGVAPGGRRRHPQQRLAVVRQRLERRARAVPLDHRELAAVVRARLPAAPALADLDDARQARRDQPLHVVLGRRDQPAGRRPPERVEVDLLPGRAHARRRVDLEEPLRPRTRRGPRAGCGRAPPASRAPRTSGGRLGAADALEVLRRCACRS